MQKQLVICDSEPLYARRLADYFLKKETDCDIRTYSSAHLMSEAMSDAKALILIADEGIYEEIKAKYESFLNICEKIFVLTKNNEFVNGNLRAVRKYDRAEILYNLVFNGSSDNISDSKKTHLKETNKNREISKGLTKQPESYKDTKIKIKNKVLEKLIVMGEISDNETLKVIDESIDESMDEEGGTLNGIRRSDLRNVIFYSIRGLDILEELINDESISEIMVNGENNIFYEKEGTLFCFNKCFDSRQQLIDIIQKIAAWANRTVNMSSPIVDARLDNGSRVNAVLEPVSIDGPTLTIRRFPKSPLTSEKLISIGAVSEEIMDFLRKLVFSGYNIIISGSTGSGKTTFLNVLTSFIPTDERIISIEDVAELKIMGIKNLVRLEARNANTDGLNEITIRDLIKTALRMRPDRIIVGEVRGDEAIDMIQSFNVGQDGSMSTIHANSAEDALYRLEMLMMLSGNDIPLNAIRRQISIGADIIIQLTRLKDKSRKLMEVSEVCGLKDGVFSVNPIYRYENGEFVRTGELKNTYKLKKAGMM